jgi:GTP pyrophosphokinase
MSDERPGKRLSERFDDAMRYASRLHANQRRKGSDTPYLAHLLAVTAIVLEHGATEDETIAALLHDAVEDQGGARRRAEIRQRYGDEIASIVDGLTDTDKIHKPSWRPRKERYVAHLATAPYAVRLIAAADKLHNARTVLRDYRARGEAVWETFTGGREGTLWFYPAVLAALRAAARPEETRLNPLLDELGEAVAALEAAASGGQPAEPRQ